MKFEFSEGNEAVLVGTGAAPVEAVEADLEEAAEDDAKPAAKAPVGLETGQA